MSDGSARAGWVSLAAAALITCTSALVYTQDLPSIFLRVTDGTGAPVTDLAPEDLIILEDGIERLTITVEPVDWPVKLTLLVDNSRPMAQSLGRIREGLTSLLNELPDGVETEILTIAPQPRFIVRRTSDRAELLDGLSLIAPDSGTPAFIDGLVEASDRIREDDDPHFPVVVMISTNGPAVGAGADRKFQRLVNQTIDKPATYHVLVWSSTGTTSSGVTGAIQTIVGVRITDLTEGRYESLAVASRFEALLPEIGAQIAESHERQRTQLRVVYMRPPDEAPPQIGFGANILRPGLVGRLTFDGRMP
jgi:hypothetical protein